MEESKKTYLAGYFPAVDRRMERLVAAFYDVDIRMAGQVLRFHLESRDREAYVRTLYTGLVIPSGQEKADAELFFWTDCLKSYLPADAREEGVWSAEDPTGFLKIAASYSMTGGDFLRNRYYSCLEKERGGKDLPSLPNTMDLMFRFALHSGMFLLHGAAVGKGGKGVLIGGMGGAGKSTLAVSCLLRGMDFAGDDYVLISRRGPHLAMPFFHTVKLCPDMEEALRPGFPLLLTEEPGGKKLLDASMLPFIPLLPLSCILLPTLSPEGKARIGPVRPGLSSARMVRSAMTQFGFEREISLIREMSLRLEKLPAFEIFLSRDPGENALCLEAFIREKL